MAIALVAGQSATVNMTAATTSMTPTPTNNFTAKNGAILFIDATTGAVVGTPLASAVSGGGFGNWTRVGTVWSAAGGPSVECWIATGSAGGAKIITVTMSASSTAGCYLTELSGCPQSIEGMLGHVVTSQALTGTSISTSFTPRFVGDLIFVASAASSTETASPSAPWTAIAGPTTTGAQRNGLAWQANPQLGIAQTATWTQTTGNQAAFAIGLQSAPIEQTADAYAVTSGNASAVAANPVAVATDTPGNLRQIVTIGDDGEDLVAVYGGALAVTGAFAPANVMNALSLSGLAIPRPGDNLLTVASPASITVFVTVTGVTTGAVYLNQAPRTGQLICDINPMIDSAYLITWSATIGGTWYFNTSYGELPASPLVRADGRAYPTGDHSVQALLNAATTQTLIAAPGAGLRILLFSVSLSAGSAANTPTLQATINGASQALLWVIGAFSAVLSQGWPSGLLCDVNTAVSVVALANSTAGGTAVYDIVQ